jgi:hypothetical protein
MNEREMSIRELITRASKHYPDDRIARCLGAGEELLTATDALTESGDPFAYAIATLLADKDNYTQARHPLMVASLALQTVVGELKSLAESLEEEFFEVGARAYLERVAALDLDVSHDTFHAWLQLDGKRYDSCSVSIERTLERLLGVKISFSEVLRNPELKNKLAAIGIPAKVEAA